MRNTRKRMLALALVLLLLALTACAKAPSSAPAATAAPTPEPAAEPTPEPTPAPTPEPTPEPTPAPPTEAVYESMGMKLYVPLDIDPLIEVETGEETLFSATEIASREAAQKIYPYYADGAGWLFSISRVTEEQLHEMLC